MKLTDLLSEYAEVSLHEPMKNHTTYRIGGQADYYIKPRTVLDLQPVLGILEREKIPFLVLGKGSNVLISDAPYHGAVINLDDSHDAYSFDDQGILTAQAGCSLILLARQAMLHSLSGLEFAYGIPGSLGGGLYMNAGAYRSDLSEILIDVLVLKKGKLVRMDREELGYSYRRSRFQQHKDWIILEARLQLKPKAQKEIAALMDSRKQRRLNSQPIDKCSAGSVFRNPEGCSAWKVVDDLGFRGVKNGGAMVSEVHSNFIVNTEGFAKAEEVSSLIVAIQRAAKEKFGIELITEIERINWHEEKEEGNSSPAS